MKTVYGHYILGGKVLDFEVICRYYNLRVYLAGNHFLRITNTRKQFCLTKGLHFTHNNQPTKENNVYPAHSFKIKDKQRKLLLLYRIKRCEPFLSAAEQNRQLKQLLWNRFCLLHCFAEHRTERNFHRFIACSTTTRFACLGNIEETLLGNSFTMVNKTQNSGQL